MRALRVPLALAALCALLFVGWRLLREDRVASSPSEPAAGGTGSRHALETELAAMREALAFELAARSELEAENEWLRLQLEELGSPDDDDSPAAADGGLGDLLPDVSAAPGDAPEKPAASSPSRRNADAWFDDEVLVDHGVPAGVVAALNDAFEENALALLHLEDQARREGWFGGPRYRKQRRDLENQLRGDLGDDRYDLLLYATGKRNRVVVKDLLQRAPGSDAGLQPGDEVLRYDGRRIFRTVELKDATVQGTPGERIALDVNRDGEVLRLYVERGPLGIQTRESRRLPEVAW